MTGSITYNLIKKISKKINASYIIRLIVKYINLFIDKINESFFLSRFFKNTEKLEISKEGKNNFVIKAIQWFFLKLNKFYLTISEESKFIKSLKLFFNLDINIIIAYFMLFILSLLNIKVIYDFFNSNMQFIIVALTLLFDLILFMSGIFSKDNSSVIIRNVNNYKMNFINNTKFIYIKIIGINIFALLVFFMMLSISFYKILIIVLGLIVLYFILRFSNNGLYLIAISIPFLPDKITLIIFLTFIIRGFLYWIIKDNFKININGYNTIFILMLIVFFINTVLSVNFMGSIRDLIINGLSIFMIIHMINGSINKESLYTLIDFIIGASFITAVYAFYQYFSGAPMGSGWVDPNSNISIRVFSSFENPNLYAEYLILVMPLTLARLISVKKNKKTIFGVILIAQLIGLLLTFSRGGWLGFIFAIGLFILLTKKDLIIKLIPVGLISLMFLPSSIVMRIKTIGSLADSSNFYRVQIWKKAIIIIKDFFITGVGLGFESFRTISLFYIKDFSPYHAHNTYLELMIEIGVLGLFLFVWLIMKLLKDIRLQKMSTDKVYTVALFSGIAGLFMHGIAEHVLYNPKIIFQFWLIIGLLITMNVKVMKVRETNENINDN